MPTKVIDSLSHQTRTQKTVTPKDVQPQSSSAPLQSRPDLMHKKMSFSRVIGLAWLSAWRTEVFHLSLLRTLFSLRPFLFSILPVIFFQFSGSLALRSEQALMRLRSITGSEQTSNYILIGGILLSLVCISWFADMVIAPALAKLANARMDARKLSGTRAILNSVSEINQTIIIRLIHGLGLVLFLFFSAVILFTSQQLALGSRELLTYGFVAILIITILLAFHEVARWFSQSYVSTTASLKQGISLTFHNLTRKFLSKLGYGLSWLAGLAVYIALSFGLVWLEVYLLGNTPSFGLSIFYLAIITTGLYVLWTNWVGFSNNFWTTLSLKRTPQAQIAQALRNSEKVEKLRVWPILVVITILIVVVLGYFLIVITNVDVIIRGFSHISSSLPKNLQILVPKP